MPDFGKSSSRAPKGAAGNKSFGDRPSRPAYNTDRPSRPAGAASARPPREKGAFFEERPKRTYGDAPRTDRPSYGNRDGASAPRSDRPSYGDRNARPTAGRTSPREMNGGREDKGRDWTPRNGEGTGAPARKPRYNSDDRAARDGRPAYNSDRPSYGNRDGGAPRSDRPAYNSDRPQRSSSDRPSYNSDRPAYNRDRPAYNRDGASAPRSDRPAYNSDRPSYGNRDGGAPRSDRPSYNNDRPRFGGSDDRRGGDRPSYNNDRPAYNRDDRAPRRDFGDRDSRPARSSGSWEERNPNRPDRAARDESRESSFSGAREGNPNKKAFFEDKVLERLESATEAITADTFESMNLHPKIISALVGMGAETPFPIQASTIPAAISGMDVLGRGKTGSGKTIAFTVPLVMKLIAAGSVPRKPGKPRALILAPTRELADQIDRTVNGIAKAVGFYTACIYGGVPQRKQENAMSRGVDIVVATPGRLEDLISQRIIDLSEVETMVVDEADHMCDLGFIEGVRRIMRACGDSQKLLFSATLDKEVDALVREFMPSPYVYEVPNEENDTSNIIHRVLTVDPEDRSQVLLRLVQGEGKSLIFTRTKMTAERLSESLTQAGVPAARLHGDLNQNQRNRNLERFVKGAVRVLVATDVAARGIHVDDVALVIQVDPPEEYKTYLHRSGRTGRAGKEGTVITLIPRSRRRRLEDLLRRAEREGIYSEVRPSSELLEQLAGPIAPPPAPEVLDFGDSRGGSGGGGRGYDRDGRGGGGRGGSGGGGARKGNFGGSGKGRWADKPKGAGRPGARKFEG